MGHTVCIIQGHPHGGGKHLCHAIAQAYADGARLAGARIRGVDIGDMDLPLFRDPADFVTAPPDRVVEAQNAIRASNHIVVIYPLWLGTMPAAVKAFFEHLCRNNFAIESDAKGGWPKQMLKGKSARVIVTMGMPAMAYKVMFGAHGVRGFESSILGMAGIKPIRETLIGGVGTLSRSQVEATLSRITKLGQALS
ncbi:MAG TPA: NAD(P)H-dependent oxidoreductase [Hyphomonadaceae bacterium]|nr:NAD(P)H-dependent oxidoreductase [Hyphomonadaceae bacterium]